MLFFSQKTTVDTFGRSATNDELKGIRARFRANFETAVLALVLAVAFFVPDGYPQQVALSLLSFCSFGSILYVCHRE